MKHLVAILAFTLFSTFAFGADAPSFTTKQYHEVHGKGLKRQDQVKFKAWVNSLPHKHELVNADQIPASTDLSSIVSPPENQGSCGSCWDFGITKGLRSAWMAKGKDPGPLSFNYLLNNCGPGPSQGGCGGGDFPAMESMVGGHGPWLESQDPYTGSEGRCKTGLPVAASGLAAVQVGGDAPSFQLLASALSQKNTLIWDGAVCGNWGNYGGGIFNQNSCGEGSIDHITNGVGYNCQTSVTADGKYCVFNANGEPVNGDGYVILMNNWGTTWGEAGYMRTRAHMDAWGSTVMYFTVDYTPPVPPVPPVPPTPPSPGIPSWVWYLAGVLGILVVGGIIGFEIAPRKSAPALK